MGLQPYPAAVGAAVGEEITDLCQAEPRLLAAQDHRDACQVRPVVAASPGAVAAGGEQVDEAPAAVALRVTADTAVFTDGLMLPMLGALARPVGAAGAVSAAEAEVWVSDRRERAADGRAFVAVPLFTATAVRP
ncbi:hypothetical protein [Streptomyces broussonetiae]|uniref:Uncharacterized protein n=1 Tax=Streptomyces broussonetiae TaxID=2686304 RepID=A0ABV5EAI3_9ACTN